MTTSRSEETLSAKEAREVFALAARLDAAASPGVHDVAETLGIEPEQVRELLDEVRARPRPARSRVKIHPAAYLGWGAAAVAVGWILLHPQRAVKPIGAAATIAPGFAFSVEPLRPLREVAVISLAVNPPPGYTVGVKAHGIVLSASGPLDVIPRAGGGYRPRLVDAVARLAQRANAIGLDHAYAPGEVGEAGFSPDIQVWVEGPAGKVSFSLPTGAGITTLKAQRGAIARSLDVMLSAKPRAGPETGIVGRYFPPAGFQLEFRGRRVDGMMSSPLAVEPFDAPAARERLFLAMRAMMDADLKPRPGTWRQYAEIEKHLKTPDRSRFTVDTLDDRLTFDVPTKPGTSRAAQDAVLREWSAKAIDAYARATRRAS